MLGLVERGYEWSRACSLAEWRSQRVCQTWRERTPRANISGNIDSEISTEFKDRLPPPDRECIGVDGQDRFCTNVMQRLLPLWIIMPKLCGAQDIPGCAFRCSIDWSRILCFFADGASNILSLQFRLVLNFEWWDWCSAIVARPCFLVILKYNTADDFTGLITFSDFIIARTICQSFF